MQLPRHLLLLTLAEDTLADALRRLAADHEAEPDVAEIARTLAELDDRLRDDLEPMTARYPHRDDPVGTAALPSVPGSGPLLVDLQDVHTLASWTDVAFSVVGQGARALRDEELRDLCDRGVTDMTRHLRWLRGRINQAAAEALVLG